MQPLFAMYTAAILPARSHSDTFCSKWGRNRSASLAEFRSSWVQWFASPPTGAGQLRKLSTHDMVVLWVRVPDC